MTPGVRIVPGTKGNLNIPPGNALIFAEGTTIVGNPLTVNATVPCPDRLTLSKIGEADNLRGRVVRAFFWLMRLWPVR